MQTEIGRLTAKGQTTIPVSLRKALSLEAGDSLLFEQDGARIILRKATPIDFEYLRAMQMSFSTEWNTPADQKAFDDL